MPLTTTHEALLPKSRPRRRERGAAAASIRDLVGRSHRASPVLVATGVALLVLLVPTLLALWLDPRTITGAPAWLKPAKFSASAAIYVLTLAWVFEHLPAWPRTRRFVERVTAAVLMLEIAIIYVQAGRGTTSHFNVATPLDAILFGVMGVAILFQTLTSIAVAVALWRERHWQERAMAWALRLGMTLTIIGALSGGLMTARPTADQLELARTTGRMPVVGAHTVGAPDGGPGLPGTGWSTTHGDLRVPHFVGLHALQLLPLLALATRGRASRVRTRLVWIGGVLYAALFLATLTLALAGQPLVRLG